MLKQHAILLWFTLEAPVWKLQSVWLIENKDSVYIIEFGVVTNDSDVMSPLIFVNGVTVDTEANIPCLEKVGLPRCEMVVARKSYNGTLRHATPAE